MAHIVGYVSEVTEADLTADRYPGAVLGSIVGKAGLEREYDDTLRGNDGVRYIEVNARGRLVREGAASATLQPTPGKPIVTTLDLDLQRFIDSIWPAGVRGAMVAMTPNGEVRALYSAPNFDPNHFVGGISSAEWRKLNTTVHFQQLFLYSLSHSLATPPPLPELDSKRLLRQSVAIRGG